MGRGRDLAATRLTPAQRALRQFRLARENFHGEDERASDPDLSGEADRVAVRVVFQDPAVRAETADRDAAKCHGPSVVFPHQAPARCDAITLGDLVIYAHPQVKENGSIEADRFPSSVVSVEGCVVDVIHEVRAVELLHAREVAGTDDLDGAAGFCREVMLCGHGPSIYDENVVVFPLWQEDQNARPPGSLRSSPR